MNKLAVQLKIQTTGFQASAQTSLRVYETLKSQIADGQLASGAQLPSSRALALDMGISRTTVVAVYDQLAAEGYIETSPGTRSKVLAGVSPPASTTITSNAARKPDDPPLRLSAYGRRAAEANSCPPLASLPGRSSVNFLYGALSSADYPALAWRRAYDQALLKRQPQLYYADTEGELELRTELKGYLRRARGLICETEQILIVNGAQQAIDLCARLLVDPGDTVIVEEPCYVLARQAFKTAGARIVEVPADEHGLLMHLLPERRTTLAYVTPSHQFPLGGVMPIARRLELLVWAQRNSAWILEDDYDGEFRYAMRPVDTLQSIDKAGTVIYVGTFSKALSPQLRVGYMVLPTQLIAPFRQAKSLTDRHTPSLEQLALASLIRSGAYERHVRRSRRKNERRRAALLQAIKLHLPADTYIEGAASGLHLVVWFESLHSRKESALVARAREQNVGVWPISPMYGAGETFRKRDCAGLVLGYAGLELTDIDQGIRSLAAALAQVLLDR